MAVNTCCFFECSELSPKYEGVPDDLCLSKLASWVKPRVSKDRFKHIKGTVLVGMHICNSIGLESFPVEVALLLHDACKEMKAAALVSEAKKFGLPLTPEDEANGHVLHGPVAALVAEHELGITNRDILSAISEHTLGSTTMTLVSKVVYLADTLEESRPESLIVPVWIALGLKPPYDTKAFGSLENSDLATGKGSRTKITDLDKAIYVASNLVITNLVEKQKAIHPRALTVRDHFLELSKS